MRLQDAFEWAATIDIIGGIAFVCEHSQLTHLSSWPNVSPFEPFLLSDHQTFGMLKSSIQSIPFHLNSSHFISSHPISSLLIQSHLASSHPYSSHPISLHPNQFHPIALHPNPFKSIPLHLIRSQSITIHLNPSRSLPVRMCSPCVLVGVLGVVWFCLYLENRWTACARQREADCMTGSRALWMFCVFAMYLLPSADHGYVPQRPLLFMLSMWFVFMECKSVSPPKRIILFRSSASFRRGSPTCSLTRSFSHPCSLRDTSPGHADTVYMCAWCTVYRDQHW